jgi:hypothetical protein
VGVVYEESRNLLFIFEHIGAAMYTLPNVKQRLEAIVVIMKRR